MTLTKASRVIGLPVVTIAGGEDVAEVKDVVYDPAAGRLVGLTLNKRGFLRGRMREVLTDQSIAAIGRDAVMIVDDTCLISPKEAPDEVAGADANRNVIGNDVLTEGGRSLGRVRDLVLLVGGRGEVVGYQIEKADGGEAFIPLPVQLAVSGVALVVPDAVEEFVQGDLEGLQTAVQELRARLSAR